MTWLDSLERGGSRLPGNIFDYNDKQFRDWAMHECALARLTEKETAEVVFYLDGRHIAQIHHAIRAIRHREDIARRRQSPADCRRASTPGK